MKYNKWQHQLRLYDCECKKFVDLKISQISTAAYEIYKIFAFFVGHWYGSIAADEHLDNDSKI